MQSKLISSLRSTCTIGRKTGIGEKWLTLDISTFTLIFSCFDTERLPFVVSLLIIWFHDVQDNSNRCDKVLVRDWQREEMGIIDEIVDGMGAKLG